jgi:hypothetical protein
VEAGRVRGDGGTQLPQGDKVLVDAEVGHAQALPPSSGNRLQRSGCRTTL